MAAKKKPKQKIVLLDAQAILHRAYHALPDFTASNGEPTGALYGLSAMLIKIIAELKPDHIVACFDLAAPTFRHEAYQAYKGTREKTDDALVAQIERSRDVFKAFNIPCYEKAGFEADDLLGTIVEKTKKNKELEVIIASGDMDTLQLIEGARVTVYTLRKGIQDTILYDEKAVKERFGFAPELLPDFKGLRGDPSDNIIGVKGIGEKTATILITRFGTIEAMYKALKRSDKQFREAGITPRIIELLRTNEEEALFSKELATIRRDAPIAFTLPKNSWSDTVSYAAIETLFKELTFRTLGDRVRSLLGATAPLDLKEAPPPETAVDPRDVYRVGVMLWLLNSEMTNPSLDDILSWTGKATLEEAEQYLASEIEKQGLSKVWEGIEQPLIPVVTEMGTRGIKIDLLYLKDLSKQYHTELSKIEKRIYKNAGEEFNINSPRQLGVILFDKLALIGKNMKKTPTGQKSTRESELEKLKGEHPIIEDILSYRELQKLLSTYIDVLPTVADNAGRVHTTFLQHGAATGRMASQNPGLQNIPIRTELGKNIRKAFTTEKGSVLAAFDYAQIELKIAAFLSGDEGLLEIFREGNDVHAAVAARVFGVDEKEVDYEMRRRAKIINFGILYGMGVNALQATIGCERREAEAFLRQYFDTFKTLAQYLERVKGEARKKGYTETFFGRRRHFPGLRSPLPYIRAGAERMAINAPIQGTQADIIKIAMVRIDEYLKKHKVEKEAHLLLQVHDELVYEIHEVSLEKLVPEIKHIMETVVSSEQTHGVPLLAEVKTGERWGDMMPLHID